MLAHMSTSTSAPKRLGNFSLSSSTVVITDPGYYEKDVREYGMGELIDTCAVGEWRVELIESVVPGRKFLVPSTILVSLDSVTLDLRERDWKRIDSVGGDTGILGIFDLSRFHDASIVPSGQKWTYDGAPADPNDLWYSLVCEAIRDKSVALIPFGFDVSWDSSMDIDVFVAESHIVAIRLSISES
jgi:hypothetical protein